MKISISKAIIVALAGTVLSAPATAELAEEDLYAPPDNLSNPDAHGPSSPDDDIIYRDHVTVPEAGAGGHRPADPLLIENPDANTLATPPAGYGTAVSADDTGGGKPSTNPTPNGDGKKTVTRSHEKRNGNSVDTHKRVTIDENGNRRSARQFEITDPDGQKVAVGRDRDWEKDNGSTGSSQAAVRYDAEGNRVLKRRQEQTNADGDTRSRNGKAVRDEDGKLVAKGMNGEANKDGTDYKTQTRSRTKANGDSVSATRRGKIDADGNKTTVKQKRQLNQKPQHSGVKRSGSRARRN